MMRGKRNTYDDESQLKNMLMCFRVSELQTLLGFAGRNKTGRKTELQARAVELLRLRSEPVCMKIRELYKTIQDSMGESEGGAVGMYRPDQGRLPTSMQHAVVEDVPHPAYPAAQCPITVNAASTSPVNPVHKMSAPVGPVMAPSSSMPWQYPIRPDVRLKKLPFYEMMGELLKPSTLMLQSSSCSQENNFMFYLTPQQATDIRVGLSSKNEYLIQVQMRFCLLETSCDQDDCFPSSISVKVNGKQCSLPNPIPTFRAGVEPMRPPWPVDVSSLLRLSPTVPNRITVEWASDFSRQYCIAVHLVKKLSSTELLRKMKAKGVRHSDFTRGLIKEKLNDADAEIATTSLRVSLMCPLGKMRMTTPCRASTCTHLQCFDASLYLQMNERKPSWICPVCDEKCLYDNLRIDGYFQDVLQCGKLPIDSHEIQLHPDGSWTSLVTVKKEKKAMPVDLNETVEIIDDIEDCPPEETEPLAQVQAQTQVQTQPQVQPQVQTQPQVQAQVQNCPKSAKPRALLVDLTLSDSDDDSAVAGPNPRGGSVIQSHAPALPLHAPALPPHAPPQPPRDSRFYSI